MSKEKMTPKAFAEEMREVLKNPDTEAMHATADELLCHVLHQLGYKKGVKLFEDANIWYA